MNIRLIYLQYAVSIELNPVHDRLEFYLTFKNDILPGDQAKLLLHQLDWLLIDCIFSPLSNCAHSPDASHSIISVIPRKELRIPSPVALLHEFVELRARESPTRIALEFASRAPTDEALHINRWTFKEFNDEANRYARFLREAGAFEGDLIGICFDKCPEAYFAILSILKIGCAYVALDPGAPVARKQFILEDSGAKILLSVSALHHGLNDLGGVRIIVLDEQGLLDGIPYDPPALGRPISADATCYCLYTSGSTGTPKGCEITHDNAVQAMLSFQRLFAGHWDEASRWLQFASFHFDVSVLEQYWSWSVGICVTSCPRDILFEDLPGRIRQLEITHIDLTPSLAKLLHPDEVPLLCRGVFITGGEQLKQEILDDWGKHSVIYNGYGPTEVTIGCTMLPRVSQIDKPSNIGPQFDNVSSFVLKPGTNLPVLRGGVGELCVSGPLVGRGYLNRPQMTAERFQFVQEFGERIYRTGDLVRMLYDESFSFLGRNDDQIKLRGQRLEIDEVNHAIKAASTEIGEIVTVVLKNPNLQGEQLVSFLSISRPSDAAKPCEVDLTPECSAIIATVRMNCQSRLPGYMVPTNVIPLTTFPLSPNNKIDNRKLKELYSSITPGVLQALFSASMGDTRQMSQEMERIMHVLAAITGCDLYAWIRFNFLHLVCSCSEGCRLWRRATVLGDEE
jgi:amino acid adenylation domain-containing protein